MKRILIFFLCAAMLLWMTCCAPTPPEPDTDDVRAVSIVRMCEQAELSIDQAKELLDVLETLGYTGEVLFAYPATDEDDAEYLHVWIGERTVDAYYNEDGQIASIRQSGILLYGNDTVEQSETLQPDELDEPITPAKPPAELTLRLDDMSTQVSVGSAAFVRVYGRAGEQYRITVHLKSGASTAKGLEEKTADADGLTAWEWKVSSRTTPGDYRIVIARISDERDALELPFTVLPKE